MHYDWVLFDADHTLFDFDRSSREALRDTLESHNVEHSDESWTLYDKINKECWAAFEQGLIDRETMRTIRFSRFFSQIGAGHIDAESFATYYLHSLPTRPYFIEGATELIAKLHGHLRLGIITNGLQEVQRPRLVKTGIDRYFQVIVVSGEIDLTKPDHAFFDHAHREMGCPEKSRVLVVGDSLTADIAGGHRFGFMTCWFNPGGKENSGEIAPDHEISTLEQVPGLLGL